MRYLTLIFTVFLLACGKQNVEKTSPDINGIYKKGVIKGAAGELAPIVFKGQVYFFSFGRDTVSLAGGFVRIQSYPDLKIVHTFKFPYGYGSVIVENETIHIFAATDSNPGNSIITITSQDMFNWSSPEVIFTADSNQTIYNTSPTKSENGYVLAYEIHQELYHAWWYVRFLSSNDLRNWSAIGDKYDRTNSSACPMLKYVDGWFYMFSLGDNGKSEGPRYETFVTRSRDLINFEDSSIAVLSTQNRTDEGNNNSDLDAIEFNGQLIIVYGAGDQTTWGVMKHGIFKGNMYQFVTQFFN